MKIKLIIIFVFFFSVDLAAQNKALPQKISYAEAIEIALKNNPDLQEKALQVDISEKEAEKTQWDKVPNIYGNYNLQRNLIIPTTPVPARAFNPNAPEGEMRALQFSTDYTSNLGLNAQWDLFNPQKHGKEKVAKKQTQISQLDKSLAENNLKYTVGKDYGACIIAKKQLKLALSDSSNKAQLLKTAKEKQQAGRIKINALNQLKADLNETQNKVMKAQMILKNAKSQLLVDMGYAPTENTTYILSDSLQNLLGQLNFEASTKQQSLSIQKLKQQNEVTQMNLKTTKQGYLPTLSLNGFYGVNYYSNQLELLKNENWYGNSYVNLSLRIPISEGFARNKKIEKLKIQAEADQAHLRSQKNQLLLSKSKATANLEYKKKALSKEEKSLQFAKQNYQIAENQFENGRMLASDLSSSDLLYQEAKNNYLQAAYDYILATIKAEKVFQQ